LSAVTHEGAKPVASDGNPTLNISALLRDGAASAKKNPRTMKSIWI
jgi:hypothetical protein